MSTDYLVYLREHEDWDMKRFHFHEQYEVLLCLSDNARMFVKNRSYRLEYGTVLLLAPGVLHRSIMEPGFSYQRYVLRFSESYIRSLSEEAAVLLRCFSAECVRCQLEPPQVRELQRLFEDCRREYLGFGAELHRQIAFQRLMLFLGRQHRSSQPESSDGLISDGLASDGLVSDGYLSQILRYIGTHLAEDLSLDALSDRFFISKAQLSRIFKEETGFSPGEYIIHLRIMRAKTLLQEGMSVKEAQLASGFGSYSHFIRTFHNSVGQTPWQYRLSKHTEEKTI